MGTTGMAGQSGAMSVQDERTWSMLSHLSILLNLVTGIGGPVAALVIWLVYKDRSPRVGFHALQSLWYQVAWAVILTGYIGGPIAALVIWLVYKDRSPRVGFHALQSLWYQVAWLVIFAILLVVGIVFSIVTLGIGSFVFILAPVIALIPIAHQCYAAYKVNQGYDYRYPFIADMVDSQHRFG
jgi:uncharacterized Tic20 family protein